MIVIAWLKIAARRRWIVTPKYFQYQTSFNFFSKGESNENVENINYFSPEKKGFDNALLYHTCSTSHIWKKCKKRELADKLVFPL